MLAIAPHWFVLSIIIEVFGNAAFVVWLRWHRVPVRFAWAGVHGHVDRAYLDWCRSQGRPPGQILLLRRISLLNMAAAALVTIPLLAGQR